MPAPLRLPLVLFAALLPAACGGAPDGHAADASAAELPPGSVAGTVELAVDADPGDYAALLVMGRRDPDSVLPDLLLRLPPGPLPRPFVLDARHLLKPGKVHGAWHLSARLDADGELLPTRDDVAARLPGPVPTDSAGHVLRLDTLVTRTLTADDVGLPPGHPVAGAAPAPVDPALPAGHPPLDAAPLDAAPPAGHTDAVPRPPREEGPRVRGMLELHPDFAAREGTGTLFLMLKDSTAARGMPRAVLRVERPEFPLPFDLGPEHVPLQVSNKADLLQGTLYLSARLDADGDALSKQPGDLETDPVEVRAGEDPVTVVLDRSRS